MPTNKSKKHTFFYTFALSLLALIVILAVYLTYYAINRNSADNVGKNQSGIPKRAASENKNMNVLVMGSNSGTDSVDTFVLIRLNADENVVYLTSLPKELLSTVNTKTATLTEHYGYAGASQAVGAVENALDITVSRFVRFDKPTFSKIIDIVGGVEFYIPKDLKYVDKTGNVVVDLKAGTQILDGRRVFELLTFPNQDQTERQELINEVGEQLLITRLNPSTSRILDTLFYGLINDIDTNLTFYDYSLRKETIESICKADVKAKKIDISGEYSKDHKTFVLDDFAKKMIKESYSKIQE